MPSAQRLSEAHIIVRTSLDPEALDAVCQRAAERTRGIGMYKGAKARVKVGEPLASGRRYAIGYKTNILVFRIDVTPDGEGGTALRSRIEQYRTSQSTLLGFIPTGPKHLDGYHFYRQFMLSLKDAVTTADPQANVRIVESA